MYELFEDKTKVTKEEYMLISKVFNYILIEYIINTGEVIRLPNKLGTLSIRSTTPKKNRAINFKHLKETGEKIYHKNYATEGKMVTFYWDRSTPYCIGMNTRFFKFKPTEASKSKLAKVVTEQLTINKYYPRP